MTFNDDPELHEMELEFLGKDSMLFKQTINFADANYQEVIRLRYVRSIRE